MENKNNKDRAKRFCLWFFIIISDVMQCEWLIHHAEIGNGPVQMRALYTIFFIVAAMFWVLIDQGTKDD